MIGGLTSRAELAHVADPDLRAGYLACKALHARHGRTYYLATLLLPAWKRPYVHALYAFARQADDIVDDLGSAAPPEERAARLAAFGDGFLADLTEGRPGADPVRRAVLDTARRWQVPAEHFAAFLRSMRLDLTVTEYPTYADLEAYMHGSAGVVGMQMVPVLEPSSDAAYAYAHDLGFAFQLTNFVRDVGEDLRRGRLYLPLADLDAFGVTRADLAAGVVDGRVRRLLAHQVARARELYRAAEPGVRLLHPTSRDCVRTALRLYRRILDEVERADYRVLDRRVAVPPAARARVAVPGLVRAVRARRRPPGTR